MTTVLILGKRGGILRWFEHLLAAGKDLPGVRLTGRALNHQHVGEQLVRRVLGKSSGRYDDYIVGKIAQQLRHQPPQLILIADRYYLSKALVELLGSQHAPVLQWVGDSFDERLQQNRCVREFLMTDSAFVTAAENMGLSARYFPLAVDPARYRHQQAWPTRTNRLLLVAAWSRNRENMVAHIDQPLHIIGKGWPALPPHQVEPHNISQTQLARLYGEHQRVLNIINRDNVSGGLNMRCFEAPAAGAALVSEHITDLERIFVPGENVIAFKDPAELSTQLAQISEAKLAEIARAGQHTVLSAHTYSHRLRELISTYAS